MKRVWVIGAGGMLGAAVIRALSHGVTEVYRYGESFDWRNPQRVREQFEEAIREFTAGLAAGDAWEIYWAAGVGSMGSIRADLDKEIVAFEGFLTSLKQRLVAIGGP